MALGSAKEKEIVHLLSLLTLNPQHCDGAFTAFEHLSEGERDELLSLAESNHVVLRALDPLAQQARKRSATASEDAGNGAASLAWIAAWAEARIEIERRRVANALGALHSICRELETAGVGVLRHDVLVENLQLRLARPAKPIHLLRQSPVAMMRINLRRRLDQRDDFPRQHRTSLRVSGMPSLPSGTFDTAGRRFPTPPAAPRHGTARRGCSSPKSFAAPR